MTCGITIQPRWDWSAEYKKDVRGHHAALRRAYAKPRGFREEQYAVWIAKRVRVDVQGYTDAYLDHGTDEFVFCWRANVTWNRETWRHKETAPTRETRVYLPNLHWCPTVEVIYPDAEAAPSVTTHIDPFT